MRLARVISQPPARNIIPYRECSIKKLELELTDTEEETIARVQRRLNAIFL